MSSEKREDTHQSSGPSPEELQKKVDEILESEPKGGLFTRRWVLASMVLLYVFIGLPLWFKLTEIYRAPLPSNFISVLQANPNADIIVQNVIYLKSVDKLYYPDLAEAVQIQVNHELNRIKNDPEEHLIVDWNVTVKMYDEESAKNDPDAYILELENGDNEGIAMDELHKSCTLFHSLKSVKNNDLPFFCTQAILYHVFNSEIEMFKIKNQQKSINAIKYSPNVHLSFKLLTGGGNPVAWDIDEALNDFFKPVVDLFKNYINFTIDSEIKYFTELNLPEGVTTIKTSDLSTVLDFSEWDVSSNDYNYPTLNFISYFPSQRQSPLTFEFDQSAFLIPQWGSIILNENAITGDDTVITELFLRHFLEVFTSELFTLLNLPKHPKTPLIRIDALTKFTIIENLNRGVESLASLLKLSESLDNISIPKTVLKNVKAALESREKVVENLNHYGDLKQALLDSIDVLKYSEEAFFDPEMVQQTFFPQEHKIAVYMPLLGPLTLILTMATLRVLKEIKLYRKKRD